MFCSCLFATRGEEVAAGEGALGGFVLMTVLPGHWGRKA